MARIQTHQVCQSLLLIHSYLNYSATSNRLTVDSFSIQPNYPETEFTARHQFATDRIEYSEHAEKANEPGRISFQEINAQIYNLTNDTIYKMEKAFLKLNAEALLMGKGKLSIALKGRIFDRQNTFSVNGTLSGIKSSLTKDSKKVMD